jgi:putative ABC transport system substrate-binding protein
MKPFWILDPSAGLRTGFGFSIGRSKCKKVFCLALGALLFALSFPVQAQQPTGKVARIGFLTTSSASNTETRLRHDAFRQGLRDLGYVEGKNINIDYRYADGKLERLPELAEELVRLSVDVLVASNATVAQAAKKSSATIPIVMLASGDPLGSGLVASLARPGGNVTGLYQYSPELVGKRLELLKEVLPKVTRFAFLNSEDGTAARSGFEDQGKIAAKALGVQFQLVEVKAPNPDLEGAFRVTVKDRIGALIISSAPLISFHRKWILELVEKNRIPAMYPDQEWATTGGLMSYGANIVDQYRRAATYLDKILKGAKPADLPVEQPTKFEFVINLKTAKALNLTIPQSVLYRADKVIR